MSSMFNFGLDNIYKPAYATHGDDLSLVATYALVLQQYTNATIDFCSVTKGQTLSGSSSTGDFQNVGLFAKLSIRDSSGKLFAIIIPSPKHSMFEDADESKKTLRVKQSIGVTITAAYSQMAGKEFSYVDGYLCGSAV
jgi:hypothetical protein